jgi:hypothetical protein
MTVALGLLRRASHGVYLYWCPGCNLAHSFDVHALNADGHRIGWDGDHKAPSVDPDMSFPGCRHLIRAGRILYDPSCSHALAGQNVAMTTFPLPDRLNTQRT